MTGKLGVSKATIERTLSQANDIKFFGSSITGHGEIVEKKEK